MSTENTSNNQNEIFLPEIESKHDGWFKELSTISENDIICRPNCKVCNSPFRQKAEERWEESHNFNAVLRLLNKLAEENDSEVKFNVQNVRSHILNHYDQQERQIWKKEYLNRLSDMMNYKISKDQTFECLSSALQDKFLSVASDPTICPVKQADTLVKISKAVADITKTQAELRGEIQSSQIIAEKLVSVWVKIITNVKDPNTQKELLEHLNLFKEEMTDIVIED